MIEGRRKPLGGKAPPRMKRTSGTEGAVTVWLFVGLEWSAVVGFVVVAEINLNKRVRSSRSVRQPKG